MILLIQDTKRCEKAWFDERGSVCAPIKWKSATLIKPCKNIGTALFLFNNYKNKLDQSKGDSGKIWRLINEILCRDTDKKGTIKRKDIIECKGKIYNTNKEISNCFKEYYRDVAIEIAKKLLKNHQYFWILSAQRPKTKSKFWTNRNN